MPSPNPLQVNYGPRLQEALDRPIVHPEEVGVRDRKVFMRGYLYAAVGFVSHYCGGLYRVRLVPRRSKGGDAGLLNKL